MTLQPDDGTCRGNDLGKIVEIIDEYGPTEVLDICKMLNRSTRYVCALVEESTVLNFTRQPKLKREWVVSSDSWTSNKYRWWK